MVPRSMKHPLSWRVRQALRAFPRENFLPERVRHQAFLDQALPIGFGQTGSQPTTVRLMLEWLGPKQGDTVLDIGSGSGWTTALLSHLVGARGRVVAVERIPELLRLGEENCAQSGVRNVRFYLAGEELGYPAAAPYDRILVSAAADSLPRELLASLKPGGKVVIPVRNDILEVTARGSNPEHIKVHPGFVFVPLIFREREPGARTDA